MYKGKKSGGQAGQRHMQKRGNGSVSHSGTMGQGGGSATPHRNTMGSGRSSSAGRCTGAMGNKS